MHGVLVKQGADKDDDVEGVAAEIASLPEWSAYVARPRRKEFLQLNSPGVVTSKALLFCAIANFAHQREKFWEPAQHAALLAKQFGSVAGFEYFAALAVKRSNGNPLARLALAEAQWMRRLPHAVLYQVFLAQRRGGCVRDGSLRQLCQRAIIDLKLRAYAHLSQHHTAERLLSIAEKHKVPLSFDTMHQLVMCGWGRSPDLHVRAAFVSVADLQKFGPRPAAAIKRGIQIGFLSVLRKRHEG